jgi:hypothetical protein
MNPFVAPQTDAKPPRWSWLTARPGLTVFVLALALGLGAVGWRADSRAKAARRFARIEAQARTALVRGEIRHAVAALQVLGALARQSGGAIPNFQKAGADLRAAWPDLATLELQPNGVVSDIVPRAGYERVIGFNVLKDPAQSPSAQAAIQRRASTVARLSKLYRGEPGIVMRTPVFQRGRDGREVFWGFVAVSMRLTEPLARARADELQQAVQQELGAQDFKLVPAPAPLGGWIDKGRAALECLGALLAAGLLWLLAHLLKSGHSLEAALADANRRLAGFGAERRQALEDWRSAKEAAAAAQTQLKETRAALQQAESRGLECQARLEAGERANQETSRALDARLKQAELNARELQGRLDASIRAAAALRSHPDAVVDAVEQTARSPAPAGELAAPETVAPPAAASPEENPPPAQPLDLPPDKPKAGQEARRKRTRREAELELFESPIRSTKGPGKTTGEAVEQGPGEPKGVESLFPPPASHLVAELAPPVGSEEEKPVPARLARPMAPVNPSQLRKAVSQILPLLAGQDPGARDCLADNRAVFQSAFAPEAYAQFEQCIKKRDFESAQEHLKKVVKRHGIN